MEKSDILILVGVAALILLGISSLISDEEKVAHDNPDVIDLRAEAIAQHQQELAERYNPTNNINWKPDVITVVVPANVYDQMSAEQMYDAGNIGVVYVRGHSTEDEQLNEIKKSAESKIAAQKRIVSELKNPDPKYADIDKEIEAKVAQAQNKVAIGVVNGGV